MKHPYPSCGHVRNRPEKATRALRQVPAFGVRRRVLSLHSVGWTAEDVAADSGVPAGAIIRLGDGGDETVRSDVAAAIRVTFDRLGGRVPPWDEAAMERGRALGGVPPLAWSDRALDRRDGKPTGQAYRRPPLVERIAELVEMGGTYDSMGPRLGMRPRSVYTALYRAGRHDLIAVIAERAGQRETGTS